MSLQRRRSRHTCIFYPAKEVTGLRGNINLTADLDNPVPKQVWEVAERSSKAEVPGQQEIYTVRIGFDITEGVDVWAQAFYRGIWWDVAAPPSIRYGSRHTQHMTAILRKRPDRGVIYEDP